MSKTSVLPYLSITITPWSTRESIGSKILGLIGTTLENAVSAIYPASGTAIFVPFYIITPVIITQMIWYNGTVASGNVDGGIYSPDGAKIVSTGSQGASGTSVLQVTTIANIEIPAGKYFMGISTDSKVETMFSKPMGSVSLSRCTGMKQQANAFPLPNNAVMAAATLDYIPVFGFTSRSLI